MLGKEQLELLTHHPNTRFRAPLVAFDALYGVDGWDEFQRYAHLRNNYVGTQPNPTFTPTVLRHIAVLYSQGYHTEEVANQVGVKSTTMETGPRGVVLSLMQTMLMDTGRYAGFIDQVRSATGINLQPMFDTAMATRAAIPEPDQKTIHGIARIPILIRENKSIWKIARNNPHIVALFDSLANGQDIYTLLADIEKGVYYKADIKNWLRYFARGEDCPDHIHPLARLSENILLSHFLHTRHWHDPEGKQDSQQSVSLHLTHIAAELFSIKGKRLRLEEELFSKLPQKDREAFISYWATLRFFFRLGFLLSLESPVRIEEAPIEYPDFFEESFSPEAFLADHLNPHYDELLANFYRWHYRWYKEVPHGLKDILFHDWHNYHYSHMLDLWIENHKGFPWSGERLRQSTAVARQLIVNISIDSTHSDWTKLMRDRRSEIRTMEDLLQEQLASV